MSRNIGKRRKLIQRSVPRIRNKLEYLEARVPPASLLGIGLSDWWDISPDDPFADDKMDESTELTNAEADEAVNARVAEQVDVGAPSRNATGDTTDPGFNDAINDNQVNSISEIETDITSRDIALNSATGFEGDARLNASDNQPTLEEALQQVTPPVGLDSELRCAHNTERRRFRSIFR